MNAALERAIPRVLSSATTLLVSGEEAGDAAKGADFVFIQGRGDRLHGIVVFEHDLESTLEGLTGAAVNWRWLIVGPDATQAEMDRACESGVGVLVWDGLKLERARRPTPTPGIFIKRFPELRTQWRKLSSW